MGNFLPACRSPLNVGEAVLVGLQVPIRRIQQRGRHAGFGAAHAAPIARRVFDYWLTGEYPSEADIAAVQKGQASAPIGKPRAAADVPLLAP